MCIFWPKYEQNAEVLKALNFDMYGSEVIEMASRQRKVLKI